MRRLVAYWTSQCDRCNVKESVPVRTVAGAERGEIQTVAEPPDWERIAGQDFCPDCARLILETMNPTRTAPPGSL